MRRSRLFVGAIILALSSYVAAAGATSKPVTLDTDPNLVGWWRFDETAGTLAADSSGHKRDATLRGDCSFDKNSAPGKSGKAIRFDAKDAVIEVKDYKGIAGTRTADGGGLDQDDGLEGRDRLLGQGGLRPDVDLRSSFAAGSASRPTAATTT